MKTSSQHHGHGADGARAVPARSGSALTNAMGYSDGFLPGARAATGDRSRAGAGACIAACGGSWRLSRAFASVLCALALVLPLLHAQEQTGTYRLIGLSAAEREADLREVMQAVPDVALVSLDAAKAEVTLRYDPDKFFPPTKVKQPPASDKITERLNSLIGGASKNTFGLTARSTVPADKLTKVEILIGVLDCKGCRYAAYQAVAKLDGVERVTVSSTPHAIIAWIDATKTKREALEDALKKARVELKSP